MLASFVNISATKFSLNGIEYHKTFLAFKVNAEYIRVVNVYDTRFQLLGTTKFDHVEIGGVGYANSVELINNLADVLFSKAALTIVEGQQIEQNRLDILSLQENSAGPGHTHDDRYYTKTQIDALENVLKNIDYKSHVVDGTNLKLYDGNTPANLIDTIDLSFFASQGTVLSINAQGQLVLSNSSGDLLSVLETGFINESQKGSPNGVAETDGNNIILSQHLPSYVDDVLEGTYIDSTTFNNDAATPVPYTPESGKIYIDISTEKQYRWTGSIYSQTNGGLVLGETAQTAYRGDRGKIAYDHVLKRDNPHGVTAAQVGAEPALGYTPANDSEVVKKTGDQTINGVKTFSSSPKIPDAVNNDEPVSKGQLDTAIAGVGGGGVSPAPDYDTVALMLGDQANQTENVEYTVKDASGWSTISHTNWATFKKKATSTGAESDYDLREQFDVDAPETGSGIQNVTRGAFTGELNFSDGNLGYYDPYTGSPLGRLTLSSIKVSGTTAEVDIPGDKILDVSNFLPVIQDIQNRYSGASLTTDPAQVNELTFLYRTNVLKIINRVFENLNYVAPNDPSNINTMSFWFDGTDSDTMTLSGVNSDEVTGFTDKIGNILIDNTSAPFALFETNSINFAGSDWLRSTNIALLLKANDFHGFLVFKYDTIADGVLIANSASTSDRFAIGHRLGHFGITVYNGSTHARKTVAFSDTTGYHKLEFKYIAGVMTAYLDEVEMTGITEPSSATENFWIGGITGNVSDAHFKDFFVASGELTAQQVTDMNNYILSKHGI